MWIEKENKELLPNITVIEIYKDNELKHYELFPNEDYIIICPSLDYKEKLEDGTIVINRYVSTGGITVSKDYDFSAMEFLAVRKHVYINDEEPKTEI